MAGGYFGGATDYSGLDRMRNQLMDAVNRHAQNESLIMQTAANEMQTRGIANILNDYQADTSPKQAEPGPQNVPQVQTTSIPSPLGLPAYQVPTSVTPAQPVGTVQPEREDQYNAASKALSRLAQYGPKGMAVGKQLLESLGTYAKLFPYQAPVHSEQLLNTIPFKSSQGDEALIAQFGYNDETSGKPVVTAHSTVNFSFPPGGGGGSKGDKFYGGFFKYGDQAHPDMPTGIMQDLDQKERMQLDNQLNTDEDRLTSQRQIQLQHYDAITSKNAEAAGFKLPQPYSPEQVGKAKSDLDQIERKLTVVQKHRDVLRGTSGAGYPGGNLDRGPGLLKRGGGH